MSGNVKNLLNSPFVGSQTNMGGLVAQNPFASGYGTTPYAGQLNLQSMTINELSWWSSVWSVIKKAAPAIIGMLETPMPSAGGIGQQSSGQVFQAMATGQMSASQLTVGQLGWFDSIVKALPTVINVGKSIFSMFEAKQGVGAASFGAMSTQGITAQEFDAAAQAIESGKFSVANMQLGELGFFDSLLPKIIQIIGSFSQITTAPQAVTQKDFNSVMDKINQIAGVVPNIVNAVKDVVKLINGFISKPIQGQSISSLGWGNWLGGAIGGIAGSFIPGVGTAIGGGVGSGLGGLIESFF